MGLPASEEGRVAETLHDELPQSGGQETFNEFQRLAQVHVPVRFGLANLRAWRAQGTPSAGGQGNARGLATLYAALATDRTLGGVELVSQKALDAATTVQIENEDLVLRFPITWGIGFAINRGMGVYGPNPRTFGHHGWGGSFGFADPDKGLGVAYAMNFMREPQGGLDPRFAGLIEAVYASVVNRGELVLEAADQAVQPEQELGVVERAGKDDGRVSRRASGETPSTDRSKAAAFRTRSGPRRFWVGAATMPVGLSLQQRVAGRVAGRSPNRCRAATPRGTPEARRRSMISVLTLSEVGERRNSRRSGRPGPDAPAWRRAH